MDSPKYKAALEINKLIEALNDTAADCHVIDMDEEVEEWEDIVQERTTREDLLETRSRYWSESGRYIQGRSLGIESSDVAVFNGAQVRKGQQRVAFYTVSFDGVSYHHVVNK